MPKKLQNVKMTGKISTYILHPMKNILIVQDKIGQGH